MSETVTQVSDTEQKIVRSRTCGCRDFYIAKLTQKTSASFYKVGTRDAPCVVEVYAKSALTNYTIVVQLSGSGSVG